MAFTEEMKIVTEMTVKEAATVITTITIATTAGVLAATATVTAMTTGEGTEEAAIVETDTTSLVTRGTEITLTKDDFMLLEKRK